MPETGDRILFVSDRDGPFEVFVMASDGSQVRRITRTGANFEPAWSPDGSQIGYETSRDEGGSKIYVRNTDGTGERLLVADVDTGPTWSPDGTRVAYRRVGEGGSGIFVTGPGGVTQLTSEDSPDTVHLAPAWSPDGTRIAYTSLTAQLDRSEIWVVNADGTHQAKIGDDPSSDPAWSPDGTRIAFGSSRDGRSGIYVMDADGSNVTVLTANEDGWPSWSPDGTRIAFASSRDGNSEIYVMNADGTGQTRLTDDPADDFMPAWGP